MLLALFALLGLRVAYTAPVLSATIDEGRHIASAVEVWDTGRFSVYVHSPPLPRYVNGLLPYLGGARLPTAADSVELERLLAAGDPARSIDREHAIGKFVLESSGRDDGVGGYWQRLVRARLGTLVFLALLLVYTYRWSAELFGRPAGVAAAALISFSPSVIAHGALATVDVAFAATFLAATYHLWRWVDEPGVRTWRTFALAFTVAFLCKFPAPSFVIFVGLAFGALAWRRVLPRLRAEPRRLPGIALRGGALLLGVLFVATWASYRFSFRPLLAADTYGWMLPMIDHRTAGSSALRDQLHWLVQSVPVPMPELVNAAYILYREAVRSWGAYLLGEISGTGFWLYFPVALAVKSTLGLLLATLLGSGLLLACRRRAFARAAAPVAVGGAVFLLLLMAKRMNIGVRHALPAYPFAAILASALFARGIPDRWRRRASMLGVLLLLWHGVASVRAHPDYLAYFNEVPALCGLEDHEVLLDSNLDWGQDLGRLVTFVEERGIDAITLSVFGARFGTSPEALGLRGAHLLEPTERPSGWFAVSYNHLAGIGMSEMDFEALGRFRWLRQREPVAKVGRSILVYHLP